LSYSSSIGSKKFERNVEIIQAWCRRKPGQRRRSLGFLMAGRVSAVIGAGGGGLLELDGRGYPPTSYPSRSCEWKFSKQGAGNKSSAKWDTFRMAQVKMFPKTPPNRFWPGKYCGVGLQKGMRRRRLALASILEDPPDDFQKKIGGEAEGGGVWGR
jgi:hypothetical protein